jgi:RimJ/RimL family protein N-acetyltransferase
VLRDLLAEEPERPLHARVAADNPASRRVLEKCGFVVSGHDRGFANARGEEIDELVLTLGS